MSRVESAESIEQTVGARRHPTLHLARAVAAEERVYILHSQECFDGGIDLRACHFSIALDEGIDTALWSEYLDRPVVVTVSGEYADLEPTDSAEIVSTSIRSDTPKEQQ